MDPLAKFVELEAWDENGKPYLKQVGRGFFTAFRPKAFETVFGALG